MFTFLRKFQRFSFAIGFLLVGLIFTAFSCLTIMTPQEEAVEIEAEVISVSSEYDTFDEVDHYYATVNYSVDGFGYTAIVSCSSNTKAGEKMMIAYHPSNPAEPFSAGADWLPYLFFAIGILVVIISIVLLIKSFRKSKDDNPLDQVDIASVDQQLIEDIQNNDEPMREYYFHWAKKLNQSYVLETPQRETVYEADCERIGIFRPYIYNFIDHRTGRSQKSVITHTITTRYGNQYGNTTLSTVNSSSFKIDGEKIWDYIGRNGYSMEPHMDGLHLNFDVLHYGVKVAYLEAAGANVAKGKEYGKLGNLPANGVYKVSCKESDIPMVFMACFCASRVEFF